MVINGGAATANNTNSESSSNSFAIYASGDVEITGGEVNASAQKGVGMYAASGRSIKIEGGKVIASGYFMGIRVGSGAPGPVNISGGEVIATGGDDGGSYGIDGAAEITGGVVTVSGNGGAIRIMSKNTIAGKGWANNGGTGDATPIAVSETGHDLGSYKTVQFPDVVYDVWVGGTRVTGANAADVFKDGKVSYDLAKGTLKLNDYSNKGAVYSWEEGSCSAAIRAKQSLTIEFTGTNDLTKAISGLDNSAVFVDGTLTLNGTGTLNAEGAYCGIQTVGIDNGITINGGTVNASGAGIGGDGIQTSDGGITVNGGNVTAQSKEARGIAAGGDVAIKAGNVTASTKGADPRYSGIEAYGDIKISGGNVAASGPMRGIRSANDGNVSITGGIVTATGGDGNGSVGINASNTTISGGETAVTVTGSDKAISGIVKNLIEGTGWTDAAGAKGKADIAASMNGQALDYKKVQFPKPATVTVKPKAKVLTYTGSAQELVSAGEAGGRCNTSSVRTRRARLRRAGPNTSPSAPRRRPTTSGTRRPGLRATSTPIRVASESA